MEKDFIFKLFLLFNINTIFIINNSMKYPNFQEEKKLWKSGYRYIAGVDEVGRGSLSGPVVASAVVIDYNLISENFKNLKTGSKKEKQNFEKLLKEAKDSKKLSSYKREELFKIIKNCSEIKWGIGKVSEKIIDKINILEATKLAMEKAIKNLEKKYFLDIDFIIIDGKIKLERINVLQKSIIKGDEKVFSCAMSSIIAKVFRDDIMKKEDKKYPYYNFSKNKGYPTKEHREKIKKQGPILIHRKTFLKNIEKW